MNKEKLKERCRILTKMILSVAKIYHDNSTSKDQKKFIETIIGAAVWYLPNDDELWTGKVSEQAFKLFKEGTPKSKLTKEHEFPRKLAAKELLISELKNLDESGSRLFELYISKYGKWNLVTPQENKQLGKFQKDSSFTSPKEAYNKAKIQLIEVNKNIFQKSLSRNNTVQIQNSRTQNVFSKSSDNFEITLNNLHTPKRYSLIPLPRELRHLFPGFKVEFELETDAGVILTKVTSAPAGTRYGDSIAGNYIQGGLKKWYDTHPELKNGSTLVISIITPNKRYSLSIK